MDSARRIFLSIPLGIVVRDFLRLGTLDALLAADPSLEVVLLTPARLVPEFRAEFSRDRVRIEGCRRFRASERLGRLTAVRRRLPFRLVRQMILRIESWLASPDDELEQLFRELRPVLVVTVHPQDWWDWQIISYARRIGIPTAGVVRSWDNLQRGLNVLPDRLAVWNRPNEEEAIASAGYRRDEVTVVGPAPFDLYFDRSVLQDRATFFSSIGLDAARPMIVYAPAGQTMEYGDETRSLEDLLTARDASPTLRSSQIVCRLHPNSMLQTFWPYRGARDFTFSFGSYIKTLGWSMTRDEVIHMANLLHHADAVLCGGTTVVMEAALFDTPTIVAGFNDVQPEHVERWLRGWTFAKHYRPIVQNKWVPVAHSIQELTTMLEQAVTNPAWFRAERAAMTDYYIPFRDGRTGQRIAAWIRTLYQ